MRVIGIDPGLARMGYGVLEVTGNHLHTIDYGCIETFPEQTTAERLNILYQTLVSVITRYDPDIMAAEELFFYRNTTTAFAVGQARGVAILAGIQAGMQVVGYTPMQVKQAVTGYGKADKRQVQEMVRVLLGLREIPQPDDTADALAVAITHAHNGMLPKEDGFTRDGSTGFPKQSVQEPQKQKQNFSSGMDGPFRSLSYPLGVKPKAGIKPKGLKPEK